VKKRGSRHGSSKQERLLQYHEQDQQRLEQQQQQREQPVQQHRPRSPLGLESGSNRAAAASYYTAPPSNDPRWFPGYGNLSQDTASAATGSTSQLSTAKAASRQQRKHVKARQPVPLFDAGHLRYERSSYRSLAAAAPGRAGGSSAGTLFPGRQSQGHGGDDTRAAPTATVDRILQQLLDEGIEQTPLAGTRSSRRRRRPRSVQNSSSDSGADSVSDGSDGSSGAEKQRRRQQQQQQEEEVAERSHQRKKDDRVLLERAALQAAKRAASPVHMRHCSMSGIADAAISAAASSAAAAGVAERAQQRHASATAGAAADAATGLSWHATSRSQSARR